MALPLLAAGLGMISGGIQMFGGMRQKKKAQKAIDNYQRQELINPYEKMGISTSGSDLVREEASRASATAVNALQGGGIRALMGGLPGVVAQNNRATMEGRRYLDDQINKKANLVAGQDSRNQNMMEQREIGDLAGLGQQLETGRQNMFSGMRGMFNGVASGLSAIPGLGTSGATPPNTSAISPIGGPNNNGMTAINAMPSYGGTYSYLDNRASPIGSSYNTTFDGNN